MEQVKKYTFVLVLLLTGCGDMSKDYSEIAQSLESCSNYESGFLSEYSVIKDKEISQCIYSIGTMLYDRRLVCRFNSEQQLKVSKFYVKLSTNGNDVTQDLRMDDTPWLKYQVGENMLESPFEEFIKENVCMVVLER